MTAPELSAQPIGARPIGSGARVPVCDLVLVSWNHLEETRPCLESLFRCTTVPTRLIIVDNGSEPHVREFLRGVHPRGAIVDVSVIQNEANVGFPQAVNQGLRASTAPYACVLNNDLIFTPRWLETMIAVAEIDPMIGAVNPASSTLGEFPPQGVAVDDYAASLAGKSRHYVEVGMCIGFCLLTKRQVLQTVGLFPEDVEKIFFEDEDFCMRVQQAGMRCVVAHGAYVHHHEHRTVQKMGERQRLFERNQAWCEERWGKWRRIACPRFHTLALGSTHLRAWLEQLTAWARHRTHIYVFAPLPAGATRDTIFGSVGLVPHADVRFYHVPQWVAPLAGAARILVRQKKRFDAVVAPSRGWATLMRSLGPIHHARVIDADHTEALASVWPAPRPSV